MEGGRVQHTAVGGFFAACSSVSLRSAGRSSTQTLSSLSTTSPVTPPSFHLFGRGLGQSGSNLYFGAVCACAPKRTQAVTIQRPINLEKVGPPTRQRIFVIMRGRLCLSRRVAHLQRRTLHSYLVTLSKLPTVCVP